MTSAGSESPETKGSESPALVERTKSEEFLRTWHVDEFRRPSMWEKCKSTHKQSQETLRFNAQVAAYYVEDSLDGRLDNGLASNFKSGNKWLFNCCFLQTHIVWHAAVIACCMVHALLAIFEPVPGSGQPRKLWCSVIETLLLCVYAADVVMKVSYMGTKTYFSLNIANGKAWQSAYCFLCLTLALDAFISPFRITRPLRPIVLLLRSRTVRNFYTTVLRIIPSLMRICMFLVFFLLMTAVLMVRLVRGKRTDFFKSSWGAIGELGQLMLTQDNYQEILEDLLKNGELLPVLLFFAFVLIGILFLLQLVLGTVIDTYMAEAQKDMHSTRLKQARGLARAFKILDIHNEGRIRYRVFDELLQRLRPKDTPFERQLKFSLLSDKHMVSQDKGDPGTPFTTAQTGAVQESVDALDFLYLHQVIGESLTSQGKCSGKGTLAPIAKRILENQMYLLVQNMTKILDTAAFLADAEAHKIGPVELNDAFQAMFVAHSVTVIIAGGGIFNLWRNTSQAKAELLLSFGLTIYAMLPQSQGGAAAALGALRNLRLASASPTLTRFARSLMDIFPAMMQMMAFMFVVHYFFAVAALDLLGSYATDFETFQKSWQTLTQVLLGVDTISVVKKTVDRTHWTVGIFFLGFYVIAVMIVLNLITALMVEFYRASLVEDSENDEANREEIARRIQDMLQQVEVCAEFGSALGLKRKSFTGIDALRKSFLSSGSEIVDEELLKQIQKDALVDLVKLHRMRHEYAKDGRDPATLPIPVIQPKKKDDKKMDDKKDGNSGKQDANKTGTIEEEVSKKSEAWVE